MSEYLNDFELLHVFKCFCESSVCLINVVPTPDSLLRSFILVLSEIGQMNKFGFNNNTPNDKNKSFRSRSIMTPSVEKIQLSYLPPTFLVTSMVSFERSINGGDWILAVGMSKNSRTCPPIIDKGIQINPNSKSDFDDSDNHFINFYHKPLDTNNGEKDVFTLSLKFKPCLMYSISVNVANSQMSYFVDFLHSSNRVLVCGDDRRVHVFKEKKMLYPISMNSNSTSNNQNNAKISRPLVFEECSSANLDNFPEFRAAFDSSVTALSLQSLTHTLRARLSAVGLENGTVYLFMVASNTDQSASSIISSWKCDFLDSKFPITHLSLFPAESPSEVTSRSFDSGTWKHYKLPSSSPYWLSNELLDPEDVDYKRFENLSDDGFAKNSFLMDNLPEVNLLVVEGSTFPVSIFNDVCREGLNSENCSFLMEAEVGTVITSVCTSDVDLDGLSEVLICDSDTPIIYVFKKVGNVDFCWNIVQTFDWHWPIKHIQCLDMTGDGVSEILIFSDQTMSVLRRRVDKNFILDKVEKILERSQKMNKITSFDQ